MTVKRKSSARPDSAREPLASSVAQPSAVITPSGRFMALDPVKLRGGYYTPAPVANWLANWAVEAASDHILEPSCGDGNLLLASAARLVELGVDSNRVPAQLQAIELSSAEANTARERLCNLLGDGAKTVVQTDDFFGWWEREVRDAPNPQLFDAVIGNPPFIRYQTFPEPARTRAMSLMAGAGLKPNKLTNVWVPFVVGAVQSLKKGGRLALVIPAELLQVTYAAQLRKYLTQRFDFVSVVSCNELFFDNAEQEVVLLLASGCRDKSAPEERCHVAFVEKDSVADVLADVPRVVVLSAEEKDVCGDSEKWLKYFLTAKEITFMRELRNSDVATSLSHYAGVDVGVVTGKNQFFVLRADELSSMGLTDRAVRLVSRSAHLKSIIFTEKDWIDLFSENERVNLLNIRSDLSRKLTKDELAYISSGEELGFHAGYKCSIRKPWYHVPALWIPDGFLFRQIYDFPRFVRNDAQASSTDTIHRLTVHGCTTDDLIASTYTYMTAASAEIEGRSYGGGVLELEPTEAERLLIPAKMGQAIPLEEANEILKARGLAELLEQNSRRVMIDGMGLSRSDVQVAEAIWAKMRDRRRNRGRRPARKGPNE